MRWGCLGGHSAGALLSGHIVPCAGTLPSEQAGSMVLVTGLAAPATQGGAPGGLAGGALVAVRGGGGRRAAEIGGWLRAGGHDGTCWGRSSAMAEFGSRQKPTKLSPLLATRKECPGGHCVALAVHQGLLAPAKCSAPGLQGAAEGKQ